MKLQSSDSGIAIQKFIVSGSNNHFTIGRDRNILIDRIKDSVMDSDLSPEMKVKVYNIIREASKDD